MQHIEGYNRNIYGGKRPNKGIQKYGRYKTLTERMIAETNALQDYCDRVKNQKPHNILVVDAETGKATEYPSTNSESEQK